MVNSSQPLLDAGQLTHHQSDVYVMYNWNLWSTSVMRTERAQIMELPNDLRLVGYLSKLQRHWQLCLRVDELDGHLFGVVAMINIPDAAEVGLWAIGRPSASRRISEWLAANGGRFEVQRDLGLEKAA